MFCLLHKLYVVKTLLEITQSLVLDSHDQQLEDAYVHLVQS